MNIADVFRWISPPIYLQYITMNTFLAPGPRGVATLVPVSNDKIQITLLILGRCALSNLVDWASGNGRTKTRAPLAWRSSIYLSPHFHHSIFIFISPRGKMKESGKRVENWERKKVQFTVYARLKNLCPICFLIWTSSSQAMKLIFVVKILLSLLLPLSVSLTPRGCDRNGNCYI